MPIAPGDIKFFKSGGTDEDNLGGAITTVEISTTRLHNIFDKVTGAESNAGDIEYRVIYVQNKHGSLAAEAVTLYITLPDNGDPDYIDIGINEAKNTAAQDLADETAGPTGVTWSSPDEYVDGIDMGGLNNDDYRAIYLRRTVPAAAAADDEARFQIHVDVDTPE